MARVFVAFRSFLAADLSFFRLIFSSFLVNLSWGGFLPTEKTALKDFTTASFVPLLWLLESSTATAICSPFDDDDWSFRTSTSAGFLIVETVFSPSWLQEVRIMDGGAWQEERTTLFSSVAFIWKMNIVIRVLIMYEIFLHNIC